MSGRVVVIGGGFAGLWSAAAASRARTQFAEAGSGPEVVLVDPEPFHTIRVRCYEADLDGVRVPLDEVLRPIDVRRIEGRVTGIDAAARSLAVEDGNGAVQTLDYARLILAAGSRLVLPAVPIGQEIFDVDSYRGGRRLAAHLAALATGPRDGAAATAVVIGGGLVGIEIACELPDRLRAALGAEAPVRVLLIDHGDIAAGMGEGRRVVGHALASLGIACRPHATVAAVERAAVVLADGERIPAATVIFATGMRANPLAQQFGVACDRFGRLPVDRFLAVTGIAGVYAAGDCASAQADDCGHATVMSCQHARPMGRIAGHNAVCDLVGRADDRVPFAAPDYVTILDLGPAGALYTSGWDRSVVVAEGAEAKATKRTINRERIYPPRHAGRDAILAAAAPVVQVRPAVR